MLTEPSGPLSQRLIDWVSAQGARVETVVHPGGHELRQEEVQALATLLTQPPKENAA